MFDYFPITFRPPPNDPYGITAQQLKDRLRDCIASNAAFAPYAFPALMERLDSTSINVKVSESLVMVQIVVLTRPSEIPFKHFQPVFRDTVPQQSIYIQSPSGML